MSEAQPRREDRILFLDLETTGLDPDNDRILEVGAVLVTTDLKHIAAVHKIFAAPRRVDMLDTIDMHSDSGLMDQIAREEEKERVADVREVEEELIDWLVGRHLIRSKTLEIAGFSIHFDRSFLRVHMPRLHGWLSHRMIDVSTIRSLHRRWIGEPRKQAQAHRALADCEEAIAELRSYRALFDGAPFPVPSSAPEGVPTP